MAESEQITYHFTTSQSLYRNRSQILVSGTRSARFESEKKKSLRPVLISALWRGNVVSNLLTFGHWKVVFSLFLILHRAFSHFMYLTFCQFRKRKMVQSWFQKVFWNKDCDVFGNLVVEIKNFNFCLFVCLFVCLYLTFCQFRKRKMV